MVGQVVPLGQRREPAVALEEAEGRHGLEDRGPHGVVVDRAGHHRHESLSRSEFGQRHVLDVQRLPGILVAGLHSLEHVDLVLVDGHCPVGLGQVQVGEVLLAGVAGKNCVKDLRHWNS